MCDRLRLYVLCSMPRRRSPARAALRLIASGSPPRSIGMETFGMGVAARARAQLAAVSRMASSEPQSGPGSRGGSSTRCGPRRQG